MNFQQAAVLRSRVVCHTLVRCIRCDFCNFIPDTKLIAYERVERHSFYSLLLSRYLYAFVLKSIIFSINSSPVTARTVASSVQPYPFS
jgi:hypothetical protein